MWHDDDPMRTLIPLLLLLPLTGCAVRAGVSLLEAQRAYQDALESGADMRAAYEMTLANEYLMKAREEDGYADYGAAEQLCKKSMVLSAKAMKTSREGGVKVNAEELPENANAPSTIEPAPGAGDEEEEIP